MKVLVVLEDTRLLPYRDKLTNQFYSTSFSLPVIKSRTAADVVSTCSVNVLQSTTERDPSFFLFIFLLYLYIFVYLAMIEVQGDKVTINSLKLSFASCLQYRPW